MSTSTGKTPKRRNVETSKPRSTGGRRLSITVSGCSDEVSDEVRRVARRTLLAERVRRGRLDIAVIGDAEMRRQHARWLGGDGTTDVLSFDLRDTLEPGWVEGQLLVCQSVARRRARSRRTDWRRELVLYVAHGCLHLCGYDDNAVEEATRMHDREDEILTSLGLGPAYSGGSRKLRGKGPEARRPTAAQRSAAAQRGARPTPRPRALHGWMHLWHRRLGGGFTGETPVPQSQASV
ncbi:MAG: rRNA maturation RNase YbeY, partial [Phycisphaerae bacterium]|nr:rRNA maturation RNase YbeY [Phycisphaerae bacterium]